MTTVDLKKVDAKNITITPCGKPVTIKMEAPDGAKITIEKVPDHGTLVRLDATTMIFTPDAKFCNTATGGNDGFVYSWIDSKGNTGRVTKIIMQMRQGDVPRLVKTGLAPAPKTVAKIPTSKLKTVKCKKGATMKVISGTNPVCPTGYKKA
jgi:hypothetical protein